MDDDDDPKGETSILSVASLWRYKSTDQLLFKPFASAVVE
jgi:hypothetical protein